MLNLRLYRGNKFILLFVYIFVVLLMANLNALVDYFQHPDIPYFDIEHLVVGGVAGLISALLFGLLLLYTNYLEQALRRIKTLEAILHICAYCKKIRNPQMDPRGKESWQSLESYITDTQVTKFSHGICPECMNKFYPDYTDEKRS